MAVSSLDIEKPRDFVAYGSVLQTRAAIAGVLQAAQEGYGEDGADDDDRDGRRCGRPPPPPRKGGLHCARPGGGRPRERAGDVPKSKRGATGRGQPCGTSRQATFPFSFIIRGGRRILRRGRGTQTGSVVVLGRDPPRGTFATATMPESPPPCPRRTTNSRPTGRRQTPWGGHLMGNVVNHVRRAMQ